MPIDTRSAENPDVDASLARAYNTTLPAKEQQDTHDHLAYLLTQYKEPNANIAPCREALRVMDLRFSSRKAWYERPLGMIVIGVTIAVIAGTIIYITNMTQAYTPAAQTQPAKH